MGGGDVGNMTRTEILRLIGMAGWLLTIVVIGADRRIIRRLQRRGAIDPASAVPLSLGWPMSRFRLRRLTNAGAVVPVDPDRFYLDAAGYRNYQRRRRRRALAILSVVLPLIAALFWLSLRQRAS
jgi:predicted nucleic acid-binding Zn ribbon protein